MKSADFLTWQKNSGHRGDAVSPRGFREKDPVRIPEWCDRPGIDEPVPEEYGYVVSVPDDQSESNINRNMIVVLVHESYRDPDDPTDDGLRELGDDRVERWTQDGGRIPAKR